MPVTVKTFATSGEAASALSSERGARYLGGGTLVMRALNEGDLSVSTVVRATDRALTQIESPAPASRSAPASPSRACSPSGNSRFSIPSPRSIGGPAVRNMGTVGGNLFAPAPFGDFAVALLALDATVSVQGGFGARDVPIEEFLAGRDRQQGALVLSVSCQRPAGRGVPLSQDRAHQAEGRVGGDDRGPCPGQRRPRRRRAHRLWRDGGDRRFAPRRPSARSRAGRSMPRASPPRSPPRPKAPRPRTTRSPAPGIGARSSACICAACSRGQA